MKKFVIESLHVQEIKNNHRVVHPQLSVGTHILRRFSRHYLFKIPKQKVGLQVCTYLIFISKREREFQEGTGTTNEGFLSCGIKTEPQRGQL